MWIVKGAVLGILLFIMGIVGRLTYIYIRISFGVYLYTQALKAGRPTHGILPYYSLSTDDPRFWITFLAAFLAAIVIGLWIMRARAQRRNLRSHAAV